VCETRRLKAGRLHVCIPRRKRSCLLCWNHLGFAWNTRGPGKHQRQARSAAAPPCPRARRPAGKAQEGRSKMFAVFRYSCIRTSPSRLPLGWIFDRLRAGDAASGDSTAGREAKTEVWLWRQAAAAAPSGGAEEHSQNFIACRSPPWRPGDQGLETWAHRRWGRVEVCSLPHGLGWPARYNRRGTSVRWRRPAWSRSRGRAQAVAHILALGTPCTKRCNAALHGVGRPEA
jgi:hypothetical protein